MGSETSEGRMILTLYAQLKRANAKQAQAIWREATKLGLSDQLEKMNRMGARCG